MTQLHRIRVTQLRGEVYNGGGAVGGSTQMDGGGEEQSVERQRDGERKTD